MEVGGVEIGNPRDRIFIMTVATKTRTVKHIAPPASALEIQEAVGVTEEDRAIVRKVMHELGYDRLRRTVTPSLGVRRVKTGAKLKHGPKG
jgi:hypothetical protein